MGAKVRLQFVGENKPDFVSSNIQFMLGTNYSHVQIYKFGMVWHSTFGDDPRYNGFCFQPYDSALEGCVIRYCVDIETRFKSDDELMGYLEGLLGIPYSMRQNFGAVRQVLFDWVLTRWLFKNEKGAMNCSEAMARIINGGRVVGTTKVLDFGDHDRVKPNDLFDAVLPSECNHNSMCF